MYYCDYHLHSEYSFDSQEKIENICEKAVQLRICEVAITDHVEFPVREDAPWPDFQRRGEIIKELREKYGKSLSILSGIESGQPWRDLQKEHSLMETVQPDFVIASVHDLDGYPLPREYRFTKENTGDFIRAYIQQMTEMAEKCDYDVLGHVTYLFRFIPAELAERFAPEKFFEEYSDLFRVIIERDKGIEINCSGLRMPVIGKTLPSPELLCLYKSMGGKIVTVGSDGHSCRSAFSGIETGYDVLKKAGFSKVTVFHERIPTEVAFER